MNGTVLPTVNLIFQNSKLLHKFIIYTDIIVESSIDVAIYS